MIILIVEPPLHEGNSPESWRVIRDIYRMEVELDGQHIRFFTQCEVREGHQPNQYEIDIVVDLVNVAKQVLKAYNFQVKDGYSQESQN